MRDPPDIFAYLDYRAYLEAWLEHRRGIETGYSFAKFGAAAGLARSTLPNVLRGARVPSVTTLTGIGRALGLAPRERIYLGMLVELAQAPSVAAHREVHGRLVDRAAFRKSEWMEEYGDAHIEFASRWYYPAVMELARLRDFRPDPEWIANALMPPISAEEAQQALDVLTALGLIVLGEDGAVEVPLVRLQTQTDTVARASVAFHQEAVPQLIRHLGAIPAEERHLAGGVFLVPTNLLPEAKALLSNTVLQLSNLADSETGTKRRAYQLAIHLMPVSKEFK